MRGLDWDDPSRVQTWEELIDLINEVGFLPLFKNEVDGFSVEENTGDLYWWTGNEEQDPWEWRRLIARSGQVAYGKFFGRKAGFISKAWFPHFANWRRDGYDFDSRWDEELASIRCKRVMDQFENRPELFSFELKRLAGFGKEGEKNFDGTVTDLQMQSYRHIGRSVKQAPFSLRRRPPVPFPCSLEAPGIWPRPRQSESLRSRIHKRFTSV